MKFLMGILFTISSVIFWYGGYTLFAIEYIIKKYWWVVLVAIVSFVGGVIV